MGLSEIQLVGVAVAAVVVAATAAFLFNSKKSKGYLFLSIPPIKIYLDSRRVD